MSKIAGTASGQAHHCRREPCTTSPAAFAAMVLATDEEGAAAPSLTSIAQIAALLGGQAFKYKKEEGGRVVGGCEQSEQ